ncbi:MAG: DUF262 domain-containing protein [Anaerolineaceae bacterium]|nr:DUF262 domain-containing protein [Anaerolineaceae bacterium]
MPFSPKPDYDIVPRQILIRNFTSLRAKYISRPPYQRKTVWSRRQQSLLLDSLFRRSYIPNIVLREVRLKTNEVVFEVIDGQQRINTVRRFLAGDLPLPDTLNDIDVRLPGKRYFQLEDKELVDIKEFVDEELSYEADLVKGINDPFNQNHLRIASNIFWRLQLGDKLNNMEVAHARLFSTVRNFLVRYADDYDFDIHTYEPIEVNKHKHKFFQHLYGRKNNRMEHLTMLGRLLLLESGDGPADLRDSALAEFIKSAESTDGIGNYSFEKNRHAKSLLKNLDLLCNIYRQDFQIGRQVFGIDYLVVSYYLLLRHLHRNYVLRAKGFDLFKAFIFDFHSRITAKPVQDLNLRRFPESRQMDTSSIEERHRIIRYEFFSFADANGFEIKVKDANRTFDERERLDIYMRGNGICRMCKKEGKSEREATVKWSEFEADHVLPHSEGGQTLIENGQVLCREHNRRKGDKV